MNRAALLLLAGLLLSPARSSLFAQVLAVRISEAESGLPIQGAFVTLFDGEGVRLQSALTNAQGRYLFTLPGLGLYSVRAQMIGRETRESPVFQVASEERVSRDLFLPIRAIELRGITAEGSPRCAVRPEKGERTAVLWEEARKALEVNAWALDQELFRYQVDNRVREYDPEGRRVRSERREVVSGFFREPFRSRPASDLATRGFVQAINGDTLAFAPDAAVLLSDPFLDNHCFEVRQGEGDELVGLAFRPVTPRSVTDIQGTLWLDSSTGELRSVEFLYTGGLAESRGGAPGGRVEFDRLPSGAWIVRRWHIRMPILAEVQNRTTRFRVQELRIVGLQEEGGEVTRIWDRQGDLVAEADRALLGGLVYDSIRGYPLAGALVHLAGTEWQASTNEEGRFRIPNLPGGSYTVEVSHPALDSLNTEIPAREVDLTEGRMSWLDLAVPRYSVAEAASEQGIQGWVKSPRDEPSVGAFVSLLDPDGQVLTSTFTGQDGTFRFSATEPGEYRLRVERVGWKSMTTDAFDLPTGKMYRPYLSDVEDRVDFSRFPLAEIEGCVTDPAPSSLTYQALGEVLKALRMESWARRNNQLEHQIRLFDRERSPQNLEIWEDTVRAVEGFVVPEFPTRPPELLAAEGFVPNLGDTAYAFAPIPEVILSHPFLERHCFHLSPTIAEGNLLALLFGPTIGQGEKADVRGVFFLDRETGELRSLSYRYMGFPGPKGVGLPSGQLRSLSHEYAAVTTPEPPESPGGWMAYAALPNGTWMIREWGSRIPMMMTVMDTARADPTPNLAIFAISEQGGIVTVTRGPDGDTLWVGSDARSSAAAADSAWAQGSSILFGPGRNPGNETNRGTHEGNGSPTLAGGANPGVREALRRDGASRYPSRITEVARCPDPSG
jgi:hypothetical protein